MLVRSLICLAALGAAACDSKAPGQEEAEHRLRVSEVRHDLSELDTALQFYRLNTGAHLTAEDGMRRLVEEDYISRVAVDPWGTPYQFEAEPNPYFYSFGADGTKGGTGFDADILPGELRQ